ncbi:hypothetical protein P5673_017282 [Acropora cervicornis]|uniref:EGF-like domain-containing protein n=1 Tax=Acropora cervicornis TaxID=6130 RepID=A0AAD9QFG0_ACRCE|nr:hypothetical protein P5673_017282 [Acropora cervicornis]
MANVWPYTKRTAMYVSAKRDSQEEIVKSSPCSAVVCENNGKCVALYKENSYVCLCKAGFTGRNCETGKIVSYGSDPRLI